MTVAHSSRDAAMANPLPICKCGAVERHPRESQRCARGHLLVANTGALKHGTRRYSLRGVAPQDVLEHVAAIQSQLVSDLGGANELSEMERSVVRRHGETETMLQLLIRDFETRGVLTPRGRARATVTTFTSLAQLSLKLVQTLGLKKRQKNTQTLEQYISARAARAVGDAE